MVIHHLPFLADRTRWAFQMVFPRSGGAAGPAGAFDTKVLGGR